MVRASESVKNKNVNVKVLLLAACSSAASTYIWLRASESVKN